MKRWVVIAAAVVGAIVITQTVAEAWGRAGHRLINRRAPRHLPSQMSSFKADSLLYEALAMEADYRRSSDTDTSLFREQYRHYFNIDAYVNYRNLTHNLNTLIAIYGRTTVQERGLNPWATKMVFDSLVAQLSRGDAKAESTAADLGHYVADAHQPLHCTRNYDGQETGNSGIHSRYETDMINTYQTLIIITPMPDSVRYVANVVDFAFDYILHSQSLVDDIMNADNAAKQSSGWNGTGTPPASYYAALWQQTQTFTKDQFQRATLAIARLWYTAWVNAGLSTSVEEFNRNFPRTFSLGQNYPNPFNPLTNIQYAVAATQHISIKVYDSIGREIATIVDEVKTPGVYTLVWDARQFSSGMYFYTMNAGSFSETKKLLLMR
jgi:hypothetical protein